MYVIKFTIYLKFSNTQLKEICKAMSHDMQLIVSHRNVWIRSSNTAKECQSRISIGRENLGVKCKFKQKSGGGGEINVKMLLLGIVRAVQLTVKAFKLKMGPQMALIKTDRILSM
jgi:hypothetical protein